MFAPTAAKTPDICPLFAVAVESIIVPTIVYLSSMNAQAKES
jgi:hypothetical protein